MPKQPLPAWMQDAECQHHQDLPWTDDLMPDEHSFRMMSDVCSSCPVIIQCSRHALAEAQGGFFAGVWLPWGEHGERKNRMRFRARSALKSVEKRSLLGVQKLDRPKGDMHFWNEKSIDTLYDSSVI